MQASDFLSQAQSEMEDRSKTYDKPAGERSMANTVAMFNALTGHQLTEEQGWKFMVCLKLVRSEQGEYRADNFVDGAAYFGLAGESAEPPSVVDEIKKLVDNGEYEKILAKQLADSPIKLGS